MNRAVRHSEAGITLIEVLVVLAVIGVAAGATMMGMGDRGRSAETEAVRLARHLTLGVDEALIGGVPLALRWDTAGYSFVQGAAVDPANAPEAWPPAPQPVLGQRHDLARPLELRLRDATTPVAVILPVSGAAQTVTFEVTGADPVWTVTFDGFTAVATPEDLS